MSEQRSEKPTLKWLKKARKRGDVAKSTFLASTLVFVGAILIIGGLKHLFSERFQKSMKVAFLQLNEPSLEGAIKIVFTPLVFPLLITLIGIFVLSIVAHLFQTGWLWVPNQIQPKWRKKRGERRIFLPLLQLIIIGGMGYLAIRMPLDPALLFAPAAEKGAYIFQKLFGWAFLIGVLLLLLGLLEFFYQKWRFYKKMHMTPQERKEEQRESEGSPHKKRKR